MSHSLAWASSEFFPLPLLLLILIISYVCHMSVLFIFYDCVFFYWLRVLFGYTSCRSNALSLPYVIALLHLSFTNGHFWRLLIIERFWFWVTQFKVVTLVCGRSTWIDLCDILRPLHLVRCHYVIRFKIISWRNQKFVIKFGKFFEYQIISASLQMSIGRMSYLQAEPE